MAAAMARCDEAIVMALSPKRQEDRYTTLAASGSNSKGTDTLQQGDACQNHKDGEIKGSLEIPRERGPHGDK